MTPDKMTLVKLEDVLSIIDIVIKDYPDMDKAIIMPITMRMSKLIQYNPEEVLKEMIALYPEERVTAMNATEYSLGQIKKQALEEALARITNNSL